jgi:hypothetical protein
METDTATPEAAPKAEHTALKETARAIGGAVGKLAALANSAIPHRQNPAPVPAKKKAAGKLPASRKTRLPRKQKKVLAQQKAI